MFFNQKKPLLKKREHVWLTGWASAMQGAGKWGRESKDAKKLADECLLEFEARFPEDEDKDKS